MPKYEINATWTVEVETQGAADAILANIEEAAAKANCELESSEAVCVDEDDEPTGGGDITE